MGTGFSAALCLSEKLLYLKTLQNGNPMLLVYNLEPYKNNEENNENDSIELILKKYDERLSDLEKRINKIINGGKLNEV